MRNAIITKRQRAQITQDTRTDPSIRTIRRIRPHQASPQATPAPVCSGCDGGLHQGGRKQCPTNNLTCHTCKRLRHLAKVHMYVGDGSNHSQLNHTHQQWQSNPHPTKIHRLMHHTPTMATTSNQLPLINVHIISSLNGNVEIPALPDSGADTTVAGKVALGCLGEHEDNLLPS